MYGQIIRVSRRRAIIEETIIETNRQYRDGSCGLNQSYAIFWYNQVNRNCEKCKPISV